MNSDTQVDISLLNDTQRIIYDQVQQGKNVMFTGLAGCGKSFLIHTIVQSLPKHTLGITSTTGFSAVQIKGSTIHRWSGIGIADGTAEELAKRVCKNMKNKYRWRNCKSLILDEISMLSADVFDKLETVARIVRDDPRPFGGVQLIVCGDFLQLPSVGNQNNPKSLQFAFQAESWKRCFPNGIIQLTQVYRQSDETLQDALQKIRLGKVDAQVCDVFKPCKDRKFDLSDGIEPTALYSKRADVNIINDERLKKLETPIFEYEADDWGSEPYHIKSLIDSCQAPTNLMIRIGAQVMLLKNLDTDSGLANGSRGVVEDFKTVLEMQEDGFIDFPTGSPGKAPIDNKKYPVVKFINGQRRLILCETWEVEIDRQVIASRRQVPLMLAYAITIHKSQGLSLDRAEFDMKSVFDFGQAYVALSRIRSLEGLCLIGGFLPHVIKAHTIALQFYGEMGTNMVDTVEESKESYESKDSEEIQIKSTRLFSSFKAVCEEHKVPIKIKSRGKRKFETNTLSEIWVCENGCKFTFTHS